MEQTTISQHYRPRPLFPKEFLQVFIFSVFAHILVGIIMMLSGTFSFFSNPETKPMQAKLVILGKKRDEKLLPRLNIPKPALNNKSEKSKAILQPEIAPIQKEKIEEKPKQDSQILSEQAQMLLKQESLQSQQEAALKKLEKNVPEGSEQGSIYGTVTSAEAQDILQGYVGLVDAVIRANYTLPSIISDEEKSTLFAEILLQVSGNGNILKFEFEKTSNNRFFNEAISSAFTKISSFPAPPPDIRELLQKEGILIRFRP